jgi:hypothetical protein
MSNRRTPTLFRHFARADGGNAFGVVLADEAHVMRGRGALTNAMFWLSKHSSAVVAMTATPGYTSPRVRVFSSPASGTHLRILSQTDQLF